MIAEPLLTIAGLYLLSGFVFAVPFVTVGVGRIDPHAAHGSWGFRLLIIPGTTFLWPLLARRWVQGIHEPPEERNAHRRAARRLVRDHFNDSITANDQPAGNQRNSRSETGSTKEPCV